MPRRELSYKRFIMNIEKRNESNTEMYQESRNYTSSQAENERSYFIIKQNEAQVQSVNGF